MPKYKEYKSNTYNLRYKEYRNMLNSKIYKTRKCKGYKDFLSDINLLKKNISNKGMISIMADSWLRSICDMTKEELNKFVDTYQKGKLNPFQYEPSIERFDDELEEEIL